MTHKLNLVSTLIISIGASLWMNESVWAQSITERKSEYQRDLDIYRNSYSQFVVKKSEYVQFGTFAAEEELINAAKQVLVARSDSWIDYWQLLSAKFDELSDDSIQSKDQWQNRLNDQIEWQKQHKLRLTDTLTRSDLIVEAETLNQLRNVLAAMAFEANGEIAVSSMVQTTKALLRFNQSLGDRVTLQQMTGDEKELKMRGLAVNAERINSILTALEVVREDYNNNARYGNIDSLSKISQDLQPLYLSISQQYQVISELSTGVQW